MLSSNDKAFVRLDGLPNILTYGCEISIREFEKCISKDIEENVELIREGLIGKKSRVSKLVLTGGSCAIPQFRRLLAEVVGEIPVI
jgi:actin-related protein